MDHFLGPISDKRSKIKHKPKSWWTPELSDLWKKARQCEKLFLNTKKRQNNKNTITNLKENFLLARNLFDKTFKKTKRDYHRSWQINIENLDVNNPRQFWREIDKLKPKTKTNIPMQAFNKDGKIVNNPIQVLDIWKTDFESLFNIDEENEKTKFDSSNLRMLRKKSLIWNKIFKNLVTVKYLIKR